MSKRAPLTDQQKEFLQKYLSGKNFIQKKNLTDNYKDYLGRKAKAQAQIDVLTPGKAERQQLETRMKAADDKADLGNFKGAYADLKAVKVDARRAANGFKSSLTPGSIGAEIDALNSWVTSMVQERDNRLGAVDTKFDSVLTPLRGLPPVSSKPDKETAFAHLKTVNDAISFARVNLGIRKAEGETNGADMAARVAARDAGKERAAITFNITQLAAMQPGSDAPLLARLDGVFNRMKTEGLDDSRAWFTGKCTPPFQAADLELATLGKALTDLSKFRNPASIFTDKDGNPLPDNVVKQTQAVVAQKFKASEARDRARVEDAKNRMEADLQNEQIAFSVNDSKGDISRLDRFDSFDVFENLELPEKSDDWVSVGMVKEAVAAIKAEMDKLLLKGPNNDVLFDMASKSTADWMKEIEEVMGVDLKDPATDPSILKLVKEMAAGIVKEVGKNYPNKASGDMSTFTLNGDTYDDRKFLGSGGGGSVSIYTSQTTGKKVVLKEPNGFKPDEELEEDIFEEFAGEARNHREVTGGENGKAPDNIVAMEGLVLAPNGQPLIAMELADGGDAENFSYALNAARESGLISPQAQNAMVQDAVKQMAKGIKQMQEAGMSHHDLKEANVFMMADGTFKIADFGLANLLDDHDDQVNMVHNSPGYEPDELVEKGKLGQKSDNFTLGVILDKMTDPVRRSDADPLPRLKKDQRVVAQQTLAPDPNDPASMEVVQATSLDRLKNALLAHDADSRPDMTQVLLSTYLNEAETTHTKEDLQELRLASAEYARTVGKKTAKLEKLLQLEEGDLRQFERDRSGELEGKKIKFSEDYIAKLKRVLPRFQSILVSADQALIASQTAFEQAAPKALVDELNAAATLADRKPVLAKIKAELKAARLAPERQRWTEIQKKYDQLNADFLAQRSANANVESTNKDIAAYQQIIQDAQAAQTRIRPDSETQALDKKITDQRKIVLDLRKQIDAIHNEPGSAAIVARLKKANEAFR